MKKSFGSFASLLLATTCIAGAEPVPAAGPDVGGGGKSNPGLKTDAKAMKEFLDWRFGMFIHWGPVALKGTEIGWSRGKQVPVAEYDSLYQQFNPTKFDADAWVTAAADAGMKYLVITAKHHDGFCLWPSEFTDYDIAATPWKGGRGDVLKDLAAACKKHGVRFCTYYTVCDWHHPDWLPRFQDPRPATGADPVRFDRYMRDQLGEIIHRYDPALIWFDGNWFKEWTNARGQSLYADLRKLKPNLLINNRVDGGDQHKVLTPGLAGDFATPEQFIGPYAAYPWETCALITTQQWAWKPDDPLKSYKQTMDHIFRCAGGNGNLLLNVGPRADGTIEPAQVARLHEIGKWMKQYGESIYGTRGGPWLPDSNKVSTFRGDVAYVHLLAGQGEVFLPEDGFRIRSAKLLTGGELESVREEGGLRLRIPEPSRNPVNTLIKLELDRSAATLPVRPFRNPGAPKATASTIYQNSADYDADKAVDGDPMTRWATPEGTKQCWIQLDLPRATTVKGIEIDEAMFAPNSRVNRFEIQMKKGDAWSSIHSGTTIGKSFKASFPPVTSQSFRLNILEASEGPTISEIRLLAEPKNP